jgi:hypothetical protein
MFILISAINFYYVISKLIILISDHTNLILVCHLKYVSIISSIILTIRFKEMNGSGRFQMV